MNRPETSANATVERATRARFKLSAWLAGSAAIAYLCRQCLAVAEKTIRTDLHLTEAQMGWILGSFFWSYALAQIPGGRLGDRFGSRLCLPGFSALWSGATAVSAMATGAPLLLMGRTVSGISQAGLFPCAALTISRWHATTERALASGILSSAMQVGAIIAAPLTVMLLEVMSWRIVSVIFALPGLLWAAGFYWWFRDRIEDHPAVNDAELAIVHRGRRADIDDHHEVERVPWRKLAASRELWLICGQQFFRAAAYVWFASWFTTYLQETRGVSRSESGWLTAIPLLASMMAALISGSLSDWVLLRTGSMTIARKGVASVSLMICSVLVLQAFFIEDATWATISIGAGAFFAACAGPSAYATTIDMGGRHVASVFAIMNMSGNLGAALLATTAPLFRRMIDETPVLLKLAGGNSWNAILVLFGTMYLLAMVCWLFLRIESPVFTSGIESNNEASFSDDASNARSS